MQLPQQFCGPRRSTTVLPASTHWPVLGIYRSDCGCAFTSTIRKEPSGRSAQPSSALKSCLFIEGSSDQVSVLSSKAKTFFLNFSWKTTHQTGNTLEGESPMKGSSFLSGVTSVHLSFTGS